MVEMSTESDVTSTLSPREEVYQNHNFKYDKIYRIIKINIFTEATDSEIRQLQSYGL